MLLLGRQIIVTLRLPNDGTDQQANQQNLHDGHVLIKFEFILKEKEEMLRTTAIVGARVSVARTSVGAVLLRNVWTGHAADGVQTRQAVPRVLPLLPLKVQMVNLQKKRWMSSGVGAGVDEQLNNLSRLFGDARLELEVSVANSPDSVDVCESEGYSKGKLRACYTRERGRGRERETMAREIIEQVC